ncbi:MAG TPA: aminotransferase class V-fold PLP-dependent enzyme [Candidatus Udaeobacter sp.]|nr:aminotransferase class V-fold PLP-dependent enzyme [Candidatus Udaeobacter sp.]
MPVTRRDFLIRSSLSLAAGAFPPLVVRAEKVKSGASADLKDWESVRQQFQLAPDYVHLALFFLASHPRPVREAIEQYREKIDANPLIAVDTAIFESGNENIQLQVCRALASYIGGDPQDIALTQNTTTGLALLYHGLPLREGDEILTTTHDHYVHHESIRLATGRCGATWRKIPLFDSFTSISPDEIAERIRKAIGPKTRAVGVTWVHSSSGVRLPIARIAQKIADANRDRPEKDRVLLIVDGVHGLGVEDPKITNLGCDGFAAGTHKWLFGPRGTGFVWAKPAVWQKMRPVVPSFFSLEPYEAWEQEHEPQVPPRAAWFSPGGFQAFEHYWALPAAVRFHQNIGPSRITARIHELNGHLKEGLARMPNVQLYTPRDENLSAGIVCFDVKAMKPGQVVKRLLDERIVASTTPYRVSYARLACSIVNTPQEVDAALRAIRDLG